MRYREVLMEQVLKLHATKAYTVYEIAGIVKRPYEEVIQILKDANCDIPRASVPTKEQKRRAHMRRLIEEHQEKLYDVEEDL